MSPDPRRPPPTSGRPSRPPAPDGRSGRAADPPPAPAPSAPSEPAAGPPIADGERPQYTRYRAGRRPLGGRRTDGPAPADLRDRARREGHAGGWRERITWRRVLVGLLVAGVAWVALSVVLFLLSAQLEQSRPAGNVGSVLDPAGFPLTSANNILVLGSDQRTKKTHEPGASTSGPSRSDVIMLIRTGGGHSARLSIPRDTVVNIPDHGLQKINAAYAFGGAPLAITVVKRYLGIPINHLVEVNFDNFPTLIDVMGGVDVKTDCVVSYINGGFSNGGYTLRLKAGSNHLNGQQALALARTRHNACHPNESDLTRAQRQQQLFQAMKSKLASPFTFLRLPWVSWQAPQAIRSDMGGPTLLGLFGALAIGGTPQTRLLLPSASVTMADGSVGLQVSDGARRAAVARFMAG